MTGKTESKVISMCIVPVKVKHEDGKDPITTLQCWTITAGVPLFMLTWSRNFNSME